MKYIIEMLVKLQVDSVHRFRAFNTPLREISGHQSSTVMRFRGVSNCEIEHEPWIGTSDFDHHLFCEFQLPRLINHPNSQNHAKPMLPSRRYLLDATFRLNFKSIIGSIV